MLFDEFEEHCRFESAFNMDMVLTLVGGCQKWNLDGPQQGVANGSPWAELARTRQHEQGRLFVVKEASED